MDSDLWQSPWADRYASRELLELFGARSRAYHWRLMWFYLAKAQAAMGLAISDEQLTQMQQQLENIDFEAIQTYERSLKHDVMAHIHAFGDLAPQARSIIHLGATSADITDNADMMQYRKALRMIEDDLALSIHYMRNFAQKYQHVVTLGYTHFQSATATTVGKRATLWIQSLLDDLTDVRHLIEQLPLKGCKGATGTGESYRALFHGDYTKYLQMEQLVAQYAQFDRVQLVAGQTYDRKWDVKIMQVLNQIAISTHKISNDFRLLQHLKEFEEPFGQHQVGSSAMAYKRNPMKAERVSSLSKWVSALYSGSVSTASTQWLERTLDDSAIRRLNIPQAFFGVNAILRLMQSIMAGACVYERVIAMHVEQELPLLLTEKFMMAMVEAGGDRQEAHELVRNATHQVTLALKTEGKMLNLIDLIANDPKCLLSRAELDNLFNAADVCGFAKEQTTSFLAHVDAQLQRYKQQISETSLPNLEV